MESIFNYLMEYKYWILGIVILLIVIRIFYRKDSIENFSLSGGELYTTGRNNLGQLGINNKRVQYKFNKVNMEGIIDIAPIHNAAIALKNDGTLYFSGQNSYRALGLNNYRSYKFIKIDKIKDVKNIFPTQLGYFFQKTNGEVYAIGRQTKGEFGIGKWSSTEKNPVKIDIKNIKKIVSSPYGSSYLITNDGIMYSTGNNTHAELGFDNPRRWNSWKNKFTKIDYIDNVKDVSANYHSLLVIKNDGTVYGCGYNQNGQLGLGNNNTRILKLTKLNINDVKSVSIGITRFSLILKNDGTVYASGWNHVNQGGIDKQVNIFTQIPNVKDIFSIKAGTYSSYLVKNDGSLLVCGSNTYGNLGLQDKISRKKFVTCHTVYGVQKVRVYEYNVYALKGDVNRDSGKSRLSAEAAKENEQGKIAKEKAAKAALSEAEKSALKAEKEKREKEQEARKAADKLKFQELAAQMAKQEAELAAKVAKQQEKALAEAIAKASKMSSEESKKKIAAIEAAKRKLKLEEIAKKEIARAEAARKEALNADSQFKAIKMKQAQELEKAAQEATKRAKIEAEKAKLALIEQIKAERNKKDLDREALIKKNNLRIAEERKKMKDLEARQKDLLEQQAKKNKESLEAQLVLREKLLQDKKANYEKEKQQLDKARKEALIASKLLKEKLNAFLEMDSEKIAERKRLEALEEKKMKEARLERERRESINPNTCYRYSTKINRGNQIISDQACRIGKPSRADTLEECSNKCTKLGDECKAFVYRKNPFRGNNCWLKKCDGSKNKHVANLGAYNLKSGDKYYQFQTWHRLQEGQGWHWQQKDRQEANYESYSLCPMVGQIEDNERAEKQKELEQEMLDNVVEEEEYDTIVELDVVNKKIADEIDAKKIKETERKELEAKIKQQATEKAKKIALEKAKKEIEIKAKKEAEEKEAKETKEALRQKAIEIAKEKLKKKANEAKKTKETERKEMEAKKIKENERKEMEAKKIKENERKEMEAKPKEQATEKAKPKAASISGGSGASDELSINKKIQDLNNTIKKYERNIINEKKMMERNKKVDRLNRYVQYNEKNIQKYRNIILKNKKEITNLQSQVAKSTPIPGASKPNTPKESTPLYLLHEASKLECPTGYESVSRDECYTVGKSLLPSGKKMGRPLQVGGWGWVPSGCSLQSQGDWAPHYGTGTGANMSTLDKNSGYRKVCKKQHKIEINTNEHWGSDYQWYNKCNACAGNTGGIFYRKVSKHISDYFKNNNLPINTKIDVVVLSGRKSEYTARKINNSNHFGIKCIKGCTGRGEHTITSWSNSTSGSTMKDLMMK